MSCAEPWHWMPPVGEVIHPARPLLRDMLYRPAGFAADDRQPFSAVRRTDLQRVVATAAPRVICRWASSRRQKPWPGALIRLGLYYTITPRQVGMGQRARAARQKQKGLDAMPLGCPSPSSSLGIGRDDHYRYRYHHHRPAKANPTKNCKSKMALRPPRVQVLAPPVHLPPRDHVCTTLNHPSTPPCLILWH